MYPILREDVGLSAGIGSRAAESTEAGESGTAREGLSTGAGGRSSESAESTTERLRGSVGGRAGEATEAGESTTGREGLSAGVGRTAAELCSTCYAGHWSIDRDQFEEAPPFPKCVTVVPPWPYPFELLLMLTPCTLPPPPPPPYPPSCPPNRLLKEVTPTPPPPEWPNVPALAPAPAEANAACEQRSVNGSGGSPNDGNMLLKN
uniref:Uncharacterized protein n=1 Tax=Anopheles merus TaxID=30066 RepID=A0A182VK25_ANOME